MKFMARCLAPFLVGAAVALFGNGTQWLGPITNFSPEYRDRTIELCHGDDEIASRVDLGSAFGLGAYMRHIDTIFARLEALKEEPLHA